MSQSNLLQGYNWESKYEDAQIPFSRPIQDEVISVYEVYVKEEETSGSDGRSESTVSGISGSTTSSNCAMSTDEQLLQRDIFKNDCMDLDAVIDSEIINDDGTITKLLGKESLKYKLMEQTDDDNIIIYPHQTLSELENTNSSSTGTRLIDKDDPRSRLHYVKYLKREGKTVKIWECGICTKEFRHQYTLMRHLPTHTDERNFKCDACGKAFRQLSTLSQHRAIHSDARPYVCEFCKKTFNRVSTLISHRKTHSEHKPHKCHLCGKGFHQKGNLRNHVFTHTNERPYKCEVCNKGFNQMSNLVCHKIKSHAHSEKMQYSCGICGKEFPRRSSLRSHEEYKHGIKYRNSGGIQSDQSASQNSTSTCTNGAATNTSSMCNTSPSSTNTSTNGSTSTSTRAETTNTTTTTVITGPNVMRKKSARIAQMHKGERNPTTEIHKSPMGYADSLVIDKIDAKALENAVHQGQIPFALLKPVKGIPVLVKVSSAGPHKDILTPATADDLRMTGKMTLSPTLTADADGLKALQIKVPVVATITQNFDMDGKQSFSIEARGSDQEEESLVAPLDSHFRFQDSESSLRLHSAKEMSPLCRSHEEEMNNCPTNAIGKRITTNSADSESNNCNELLELAAQGGIQFVRATEDGRYEVMTNSEARDLMAQNSHDVTILDGEDADALNIINSRGQSLTLQDDLMIDHPESQIMVLDSVGTSNIQKSDGLGDIEIFEEKEIKLLDPKNFDDRMIDGMTFLSQMKMDDLILIPGNTSANTENSSISMISPNSHDLSDILDSRNDILSHGSNSQQTNVNSLLTKNQQLQQQQQQQSSISILNDTMNYLRNCPPRNFNEEFNILNEVEEAGFALEHHQQQYQQPQISSVSSSCPYGGKMKFDDYEDMTEVESSNLLSISQQEMKFLEQHQDFKLMNHHQMNSNCLRVQDYYHGNDSRNYWNSQRNLPNFGEVKILGPKNSNLLDTTNIQLHDIRNLGNYEKCMKISYGNDSNSMREQQFTKSDRFVGDTGFLTNRREVKILGKKLESGYFETTENGELIKIDNDNEIDRKMVSDVWEGWIERNISCNDNENCAINDEDKENDITYADLLNSKI